MNEELQGHLDALIDRNLAAGMTPDEARYAALRAFGGVAQIAERARDERRSVWVEHLLQDVRFALRMLRKTPGFTLVAVVSLAIGIGLNTAVFSIINTIFYQTIRGVPAPDRVLIFNDAGASIEGYRLLRDQAAEVAAISAARSVDVIVETAAGDRRGRAAAVAADYFSVLGARPAFGRFFSEPPGDEPQAHSPPEGVLTHAFWQKHFAADPAILGRVLRVNGTKVTVIGVAAREFHGPGPEGPAMWVPLGLARMLAPSRNEAQGDRVGLIGRLRPGATLEQAQALVTVIAKRAPEVFGPTLHRLSLGREDWRGGESPQKRVEFLLVTTVPLIVVGGLLWIACSNVGNLLLARGVQRRKEIAIRVASGASRGRLIRMLMVESVMLALLGGAAGLWVSGVTLDFIFATLSEFGAISVQLDRRVLAYTAGVCVIAAGLFGLVPAIQASKTDVNGALKGDGDQPASRGKRLRTLFLASQIASSVALLIVAGTFIKTLIASAYVGPQARLLDHLVLAQLPAARNGQPPLDEHYRAIAAQVNGVPGVEAASLAEMNVTSRVITRPGEPVPPQETERRVGLQRVDGTFARTVGLTLVSGALLTESTGGELRAAMINEPMARSFGGAGAAVGARFNLDGEAFVVSGVVGDGDKASRAYTHLNRGELRGAVLLVRTQRPAEAMTPSIAALLRSHSGPNELLHVAPLRDVAFRSVSLLARLGTYIGLLALSLAAAGVYASMAFSTTQRTREVGVRLALGATRAAVLALMLRRGFGVIACGMLAGLMIALVGLRLLVGLLGGGGAGIDIVAIAGVIAFFALIAAMACFIPAWRAARLNPLEALRTE